MRTAARAALGAAAIAFLLGGCANVKPYEREKLADPIMNLDDGLGKQTLEQKLFSTREALMMQPSAMMVFSSVVPLILAGGSMRARV